MNSPQVAVAAQTETEFAGLQDAWNALYHECEAPTPFASWEWAWQWWQSFGTSDSLARLLILSVSSDDTLIGLFPLYYQERQGSRLKTTGLRPFGVRGHGSEAMTEAASSLLRQGHEREAVQAVSAYLYQKLASLQWEFAHLQALCQESVFPRNRLLRHGKILLTRAYREEPMITRNLPADWDALHATLRKGMREKLAYYPRRLTQNGYSWSIQFATTAEQISTAADTLIVLHRKRASRPHRQNSISSVQHEQFLKTMLITLSAQGKAAILSLIVDGVVIGAQAVLADEKALYYYYSGFDPDWHLYGPLTILQEEITRYAFREGKRQINFLWKDELWKTRWGGMPTARFQQTIAFRANPLTLIRAAYDLHHAQRGRVNNLFEIPAAKNRTRLRDQPPMAETRR